MNKKEEKEEKKETLKIFFKKNGLYIHMSIVSILLSIVIIFFMVKK